MLLVVYHTLAASTFIILDLFQTDWSNADLETIREAHEKRRQLWATVETLRALQIPSCLFIPRAVAILESLMEDEAQRGNLSHHRHIGRKRSVEESTNLDDFTGTAKKALTAMSRAGNISSSTHGPPSSHSPRPTTADASTSSSTTDPLSMPGATIPDEVFESLVLSGFGSAEDVATTTTGYDYWNLLDEKFGPTFGSSDWRYVP